MRLVAPCKQVRSARPLPLIRPRWGQTIGRAEHPDLCHGAAAAIPSTLWVETVEHGWDGWSDVAFVVGIADHLAAREIAALS